MIDPWKRDNKSGGAWMSNLVNQSYLRGTQPVVFNVGNFTKPAAGPAGADQLRRRDHHVPRIRPRAARHVRRADLSDAVGHQRGARLRRVPVPVQRELGARSEGAAHYAVHYQTGQPIPQALVDKIKKSRTFNQGYEHGEALEAARLDLDWHSLPATRRGRKSTVRDAGAGRAAARHRRRAAALPLELFPAHLGQRLFGGLLLLPVDADARPGRRSTGSRPTAG